MTVLDHILSRKDEAAKHSRLVRERRQLSTKLLKLEQRIAKLEAKTGKRKKVSGAALEKIFDQLAEGLAQSKSLPPDFSRADIYLDHD